MEENLIKKEMGNIFGEIKEGRDGDLVLWKNGEGLKMLLYKHEGIWNISKQLAKAFGEDGECLLIGFKKITYEEASNEKIGGYFVFYHSKNKEGRYRKTYYISNNKHFPTEEGAQFAIDLLNNSTEQ